jgi:Protein of unknown function (DUF4232)
MSSNDPEQTLRDRLRGAIDPMVPGPEAANRVMDTVAGKTSDRNRGGAGSRIGRGFGTLLVASLVVVLVGGALGISLALRGRTVPTPSGHSHPPILPTATASPTVAPHPSPMPSPSGGLAACRSGDLSARFADANGAAGTQGGDIVLENIGAAPCTMEGYTNLQGVADGHATQLGVTHNYSGIFSNNGRPPLPRLVTLAPGHNAYVAFVYSDVQSTPKACPTYTTLLITPPNGGVAVLMATSPNTAFMLCSSVAASIWIDEAPVSAIAYFAMHP